jgi:transcriptional regulator with XRE-family HTH domain
MALPMVAASSGTQRLLEYNDRRTEVLRAVNRLRYGTRADISRALGVSPATISGVLNGRIVDPKKLSDIEDWLQGK